MDALSAGLSKLGGKITAEQQSARDRKTADWAAVQADHPDVAEHIKAMGAVFGRPALVRVRDDAGTVVLDSRRYE